METGQIKVDVQPTYTVKQTIVIQGDTPTDEEELAYCGKLTIYFTDEMS